MWQKRTTSEGSKAMAKDPVCGMEVSPESAVASTEFNGVTYYFCAQGCKDAFLAEPHRYIGGEATEERHRGAFGRLFRRR